MPDDTEPYTTFEPGQLITAEAMNAMQQKIRDDIGAQIGTALGDLSEVPKAGDSDTLGGETSQELLDRFMERALEEIPSRTGYRKLFKVLKPDERALIEHGLGACPLVDIYALLDFEAVCDVDEQKNVEQVRFYLYHTSEKKIRRPGGGESVVIEETRQPPFRFSLAKMLELYNVPYTDSTSLGDLETEFWTALFSPPNDAFDPDQYCHSPWYERCCREERTVESLKEKGDWDELWLKILPLKTVNFRSVTGPGTGGDDVPPMSPLPVAVAHYDLNKLGLKLLPGETFTDQERQPHRVMVLLKV